MDKANFNSEKIGLMTQKLKEFILSLYELGASDLTKNTLATKRIKLNDDSVSTDHEKLEQMKKLEGLDEIHLAMLEEMQQVDDDEDNQVNDVGYIDDQVLIRERIGKLKQDISDEVDKYIKYCKYDMEVDKDIETTYGNENYKKDMLDKNMENMKWVKSLKEPYYTFKYFDVLKWWRDFGANEWPMISTAAVILLGKPTHNGYQERVFSRGTYMDCKLKQSLKESSYEMAVLNSITTDQITKLKDDIRKNNPGLKLNSELTETESEKWIKTFYENENLVLKRKNLFPEIIEEEDMLSDFDLDTKPKAVNKKVMVDNSGSCESEEEYESESEEENTSDSEDDDSMDIKESPF